MAALSYETLGSISGISDLSSTTKVPASSRSRDRNDKQRLAFSANSNQPFSGIVHVQATVSDPTTTDNTWFDIAEMQILNEGGIWSYEPIGEFASLRVVCKAGNYWTAVKGTDVGASFIGVVSDFTISTDVNGVPTAPQTVNIALGDTIPAIIIKINALAIPNIVADLYSDSDNPNGALRIYNSEGCDITLVDGTNNPLVGLGLAAGTFSSGSISSITMLR